MAKKINYAELYTLRKDGRYMGSYTDESGRHFVYDRDPEQLHKKIQNITAKKREQIATFKMVAEEWEREHREQIEIRTWKNYLPHFNDIISKFGDLPFEDVTALDVSNDLLTAKAKNYSATIVKTRRSLYSMIFDYAVVHGHAKYNPVHSIRLPKGLKQGKRKAPTHEQMVIIMNSIDAPFGLFPYLLLCTGLRKSEALALQWKDIDLKSKTIQITKSLDTTNGANPKYKAPKTEAGIREVPILDVLIKPLEIAQGEKTSDLVFPSPPSNRGGKGGGIITARCYDGLWERYCAATGLIENGKPAITAHNLRHGTATLMFEMNVDELTAQKILGHSRIEITREIYTDLRAKKKIQSVQKLNRGMTKMLSNSKNENGSQKS